METYKFNLIDMDTWARREHFELYSKNVPCTYSTTANLDSGKFLSTLKARNLKFYPSIIYCITKVVNKIDAFKMDIDDNGNLGIYSKCNPSYTVLHKDTETFSSIWTEFCNDFDVFYEKWLSDIRVFGGNHSLCAKPSIPNSIDISAIPWISFHGFNLNLQKGYNYYKPIFTIGKYYEQGEATLLPLSIQVHHAVCDGFHVGKFVNLLQDCMDNF